MPKSRKKIGVVCVDSGQLMIIDPCYDASIDDEPYIEYARGKINWDDIPNNAKKYGIARSIDKLGLIVSQFGGDGEFPVYANIGHNGVVESITIKFNGFRWNE